MKFAIASNMLNRSDSIDVRASKKSMGLRSLSVALFIFLMFLFASGKLISTRNVMGCNKLIVTKTAISR